MRKYTPTHQYRERWLDQDVYRFDNGFRIMVTRQPRGHFEFAIMKEFGSGRYQDQFFSGNEITGMHDAVERMGSDRYDDRLEEVLGLVEAWPADKARMTDDEGY